MGLLEKLEFIFSIIFVTSLIVLAVVADVNYLGTEGALGLATLTAAVGGTAIALHYLSADKP